MQVNMDASGLNYFEALASQTRLNIIHLLSQQDMNIKELADALDISSSIITKHIRKLESARLITTRSVRKGGSRYKVCSFLDARAEVLPPAQVQYPPQRDRFYHTEFPVGMFTDLDALSPCGLADNKKVLGALDMPAYLFAPERHTAQLLWMDGGYVEYTLPNYLREGQELAAVEISGEFGTLPDAFGDTQPVAFSLNYTTVCTFFAMGFPLPEGRWPFHRHGLLVVIRIDEDGVFVNGERRGDQTVHDLNTDLDRWILRFTVDHLEDDDGGLAIFGEQTGGNRQTPSLRVYFR